MSTSLLSTKLYIPKLRLGAVMRPRLTEKLLGGLMRPASLVLISSPAGFGKTTLLSELVSQLASPPAWVSLDDGDNDPIRFWTYLITACQAIQSGAGETALALFQSLQPPPLEAVPTLLINDLARLEHEQVLVLDDYHAIHNPAIHQGLSFLIDHLPEPLHILLATRVDPPWPLPRWRASNRLAEIRVSDLRFTTSEATAFLDQMLGLSLPAEDITALEVRTEGWIAGLQLAALSMIGSADLSSFIKAFTGSHVYVAEYLVEEVLQRQPAELQMFFMQTAVLERMNGPLCEAVTGCANGQERLAALHRANLFVIPLDDFGEWFRYHHLFADLLRARARQALPAAEIAALHRRAAAWFEQAGVFDEAVNHALAAQDYDHAARLIEQHAFVMVSRGELNTVLRWTEALPAEAARQRPLAVVGKAWVLTFAGDIRQVEPLLQQAEASLEWNRAAELEREVRGNVAAIRAFIATLSGEYERALSLAERAEAFLTQDGVPFGGANSLNVGSRSVLPYTKGTAYRGQGAYAPAIQAFEEEVQMGAALDNPLIWVGAVYEVVNTRRMQGRLRQAIDLCRQTQRRLAEQGLDQLGAFAKLDAALAEILREQNGLDEALARVGGAIARMQTWGMPADLMFAYLTQMHIQESRGDLPGAFETLKLAKRLRDTRLVFLSLDLAVDLHEIRLRLAGGELEAAARLIDHVRPQESRLAFVREQGLNLIARLRLAERKPDEAIKMIEPLVQDPQGPARLWTWLESQVVYALALGAFGQDDASLEVLLQTLALAEQEGFKRIFLDEGPAMQRLLIAAATRLATTGELPELHPYIQNLLQAFPPALQPEAAARAPARRVAPEALIAPLTEREQEVLRWMAEGLTYAEIAAQLFLSVNTVRTYVKGLYGKLGVGNRTQALAAARRLGLMEANR